MGNIWQNVLNQRYYRLWCDFYAVLLKTIQNNNRRMKKVLKYR